MTGVTVGRQRSVFQAVSDLLAHEIVVAAIFELQPDETESEYGVRTDVCKAGRAGDSNLQRNSDIAFDFFG